MVALVKTLSSPPQKKKLYSCILISNNNLITGTRTMNLSTTTTCTQYETPVYLFAKKQP